MSYCNNSGIYNCSFGINKDYPTELTREDLMCARDNLLLLDKDLVATPRNFLLISEEHEQSIKKYYSSLSEGGHKHSPFSFSSNQFNDDINFAFVMLNDTSVIDCYRLPYSSIERNQSQNNRDIHFVSLLFYAHVDSKKQSPHSLSKYRMNSILLRCTLNS